MKKIIFTVGYNCGKTVRKTIESVLNQTFTDFEYRFIDNGCTDNTPEILAEYAEKDERFVVYTRRKNHTLTGEIHPTISFFSRIIKEPQDYYVTNLDADDWWEPDYLEKMISFLENNDLDLAVTGTKAYFMETKTSKVMRKLDEPLILTQKEFADNYPQLWTFPSTNWACLFKTDIYKNVDPVKSFERVSSYGSDTALTLEYIKYCKKIGIDNTALYNYRIYPQSISYNYDVNRFKSNVGYYECIKEFLEDNNALDESKKNWLKKVYISSLKFTLETLSGSNLSNLEKIQECLKIVSHDLTKYVLAQELEVNEEFKINVRNIINKNAVALIGTENEHLLTALLNEFLINCKDVFEPELMPLFIKEPTMWDAFIRDEAEEMLNVTLDLIDKNPKYRREYNLPEVVKKLIPEGTPVSEIKDEKFFNLYAGICKMVLDLQNTEALEKMTEILFSGNELNCPEDFLNLYVTLAALENHVEAFLFGNIQKAYLFIDEKRLDEAKQIVNDLVEMGAGLSLIHI